MERRGTLDKVHRRKMGRMTECRKWLLCRMERRRQQMGSKH